MSFPIFPNGAIETVSSNSTDSNRDSDYAGKLCSVDFNLNSDCAACLACVVSEFSSNLENPTMSNENTNVADNADVNDLPEVRDLSAKQACTTYVKFTDLYRSDNVRGRLVTRIPEMVESLRINGFKSNHPLVVSEKTDGTFLVLVGNRRVEGLEHVRDNHADEFNSVLPGGKIPCIIHKGLTVEEEIVIRNDHSDKEDRVGLDDWSRFLAIKQLMQAFPGDSETRIATKMGLVHKKGKNEGKPNRSYVQPRVNLARLPIFVQEQFRLLWEEGKDATAVRTTDIRPLYAVYNEEFGKHEDADSYAGEFGIGPKFREAWEGILAPAPEADSDDGTVGDGPEDLSHGAAKTRAMGCNSRLAKRILLAATNQGGALPDLDALAASIETDSQILTDIRAYLGADDYAELVNGARQQRLDAELAQSEESADADETVEAS